MSESNKSIKGGDKSWYMCIHILCLLSKIPQSAWSFKWITLLSLYVQRFRAGYWILALYKFPVIYFALKTFQNKGNSYQLLPVPIENLGGNGKKLKASPNIDFLQQ